MTTAEARAKITAHIERAKAAMEAASKGVLHNAGGDVRDEHDREIAVIAEEFKWEPEYGPRDTMAIIADGDKVALAWNSLPAAILGWSALAQHFCGWAPDTGAKNKCYLCTALLAVAEALGDA